MTFTLVISCFLCLVHGDVESDEQLIIFEIADKTRVQKLFHDKVLPQIIELAKKNNISLILKTSRNGLPAEITTLPAIIYQNPLGRSIYRGRFSQISRIANFIQTSKFVPQKNTLLTFKSAAVEERGRAKIVYPIKISTVTGGKPKDYDDSKFKLEMKRIIIKSLKSIKLKKKVSLQPLDKRFYFDFYPWVSDKGVLYLSGKIFSQHHCKKFIWTTGKTPFVSSWKNRKKSFQSLAKKMYSELNVILAKDTIGDSFDVVSKKNSSKSWGQLNIKLPELKNNHKKNIKIGIPLHWEIKGKLGKNSRAQFSIAPPNDNYSGLIRKMNGAFSFGKGGQIALSKGWFEADMLSITMGDSDLDDSLLEEDMFHTSKFAASKIVFSPISSSEIGKLKFGEESQVKTKGLFVFKGIKETMMVDLSFEPTIDHNGAVKLFLKAQFEIELTKYAMVGAPGKHDKRNVVQFFIRIYMNEKKESK